MVDRVKALKLESPDTGGSQTDLFPTSVNKNEDLLDCRGVSVQDAVSDDDSVRIHRSPAGDMLFRDQNVPGVEHTLTELYLCSSAAAVQNIPFANLSVLLIEHNRHYFPLVQVVVGDYAAWNLGGWSLVPWNGGVSEFVRLPDDQYVTTHISEDAFWVEFAGPLTGKVLYY